MLARTLCVVVLASAGLSAQFPPEESAKLTASFYFDSYGHAAAADGERVFVGSPSESGDQGRVYVYVRVAGRWTLEAALQPDAPVNTDRFGASLDADGDLLVVGAPGESPNTKGKAFIFRRTGTSWEQELTLVGPALADSLGSGVAISGDLVAIGAPGDDDSVFNGGAVYLVRRDGPGWTLEEKLRPMGGTNGNVGLVVDVGPDRVLAGSHVGHAYTYVHGARGWDFEQTLSGDEGPEGGFGTAVALRGEVALVGAWDELSGPGQVGAAYLFQQRCASWELVTRLVSPQPSFNFGLAVALDDGVAVVGDRASPVGGPATGAAFVFRSDGLAWNLEQALLGTTVEAQDEYGSAVAVSGDVILVGAPGDDDVAGHAGAAYVHEGLPLFEPWTDLGQALAGASGTPSLSAGGTLVPGTPLALSVACGAAGAPATLVAGATVLAAPFKGGVLVPHPDLLIPLALGPGGGLLLSTSWPALPSGFSFAVQVWIVDAGAPSGLAATNGVQGTTP